MSTSTGKASGRLKLDRVTVRPVATPAATILPSRPVLITVWFSFTGPDRAVMELPRQLEPIDGAAMLRTPAGRRVATAAVRGHELTVSPYRGVAAGWTGRLALNAELDADRIQPGRRTRLRFATVGSAHTVAVADGAPVNRSLPSTAGQWADPTDQGHLYTARALSWTVQSALGTRLLRAAVRPGRGHRIECPSVAVLLGKPAGPSGRLGQATPARAGSFQVGCTPARLRVVVLAPRGQVVEVRFATSPTLGRRRYRIFATVAAGNAAPQPTSAFVETYRAIADGRMTSVPAQSAAHGRKARHRPG